MKRLPLVWALVLAWPAFATDLSTALRAAQSVDPQLASASANRDAAAENEPLARSRLLPQVNLQGSAQHLNQTNKQLGKTYEFTGPSNSFVLSVRQGLFRPRDWAGWDIGKLQAQYGEVKLASTASDLAFRTATAWVDVLVAQAQRDVYAAAVESVGMAAAQEKKRLALGDGTRDAAAEAAAQLAQAQSQMVAAELDLQARLAAFRLLTRMDGASFKAFELPRAAELKLSLGSEDAALARMLETSPELTAARLNELVAERKLAQAVADQGLALDAIASYNRSLNDSTNLGTQYHNTLIGLQLTMPIYTGGGLTAAQRQAAATYAAATADRDAAVQRLSTQFTNDWKAQEGLVSRILAARELVLAGQEVLKAAQLGIRGGLRTWADVGGGDMLVARRRSDEIALTGNLVKTQARLLSLFPLTEPSWEQWAASTSVKRAAQ